MLVATTVALRVLRRRPRHACLLVLAALITALSLNVALAAVFVREREAARSDEHVPVFGQPGDGGLAATETLVPYRGRGVRVVRLPSDAPRNRLPPGVLRAPDVDEVLVSPALARLRDRDGLLENWFGARTERQLDRRAVGSAGDLLAVVGEPPSVMAAEHAPPIVGFGGPDGSSPGFGWYELVAVVLFVVVPTGALMLVASRFDVEVRRQRHDALVLAGMSRRLSALSVALEFVIPSAVGAAAAIVVAPFATPDFFVLPVVDRAVFGADVTLPGGLRAALALFVSVAFGVMSARSVRARDTSSTTELLVGITRRRASGMLFAAGICMALVAWQRAVPRDPVLWGAIALLSAGLPGAVATASRHLARVCGRVESGSPTALLATRRIMADPRSTTRVASVIGVALLVYLTAQPAADAVKVPPQPWIEDASVASSTKGLAGRAESLANVPFTAVSADRPPAVRLSLPVVGLWARDASKLDRPSATAVVATCDDLSSFVGRSLEECSGRPQHVATPDSPPALAGDHELRTRSRALTGAVGVPGDVQPVVVPDDALIDSALILPPWSVPDDVYETGALMVVDPSAESWERARAWVMASNPAGRLENALEASAVRDTTAPWLLLGLATGMAIILAGALLGAIERPREHRDRSLRMLGVRPSELTVARTIQGVVTAIPAAVFAGAGAAVLGVAFRSVGGVGPGIGVYIVASFVAGLLTVVVSAISSAASAFGRRR